LRNWDSEIASTKRSGMSKAVERAFFREKRKTGTLVKLKKEQGGVLPFGLQKRERGNGTFRRGEGGRRLGTLKPDEPVALGEKNRSGGSVCDCYLQGGTARI